jgi:hypothetical protein
MISPSQGRYLYTGKHKHRINGYIDIHAMRGIRTPIPTFEWATTVRALDGAVTVIGIQLGQAYSSEILLSTCYTTISHNLEEWIALEIPELLSRRTAKPKCEGRQRVTAGLVTEQNTTLWLKVHSSTPLKLKLYCTMSAPNLTPILVAIGIKFQI